MRKELIFFLLFAGLLGWKFNGMLSDSGGRARRTGVKRKDYEGAKLPDIDLAIADPERVLAFDRDLFSPPSATEALPPLFVVLPPLEPLGALAPPTGWGPVPALYAQFLRRPDRPEGVEEVPGLFDETSDEVDGPQGFDPAELAEALAELDDDPDARAAQIEGLKKQYDWVYTNEFKFGRIQNANRYRLGEEADPVIELVIVDPVTGKPQFNGVPIQYDATQHRGEFGLVDNALTRVELGFAKFDDPLQPSQFEPALQFANQCLVLRNETDRALEIAETLFGRAQDVNVQDDPRPRLGLATCYQLGFRMQDAYDAYRELLESGHDKNASVHARLGVLLAQLRMPQAAEVQFQEGLRVERTNWEGRYWYGRFLLRNERVDEALPHLREAVLREPKAPGYRAIRVMVRLEYAGALLWAGQMTEAMEAFGVAMSADQANEIGEAEVCAAGMLTAARFVDLGPGGSMSGGPSPEGGPVTGGFEVLLAAGLFALDQGEVKLAAQALGVAADGDPFRRYEAMRALSRVAEVSGNPEEAQAFIDEALRGNPVDAWSLYQRGRLSEAAGDEAEARSAYRAALDIELDLTPALERMAALLQSAGEHEAAERYYERATAIEPERAVLWSRRGWNALQLGDLALAERCLREARRLQPSLVSARAGLAWWYYASGDSAEAITQFSEIVDDRRSAGAEDAMLQFAESQGERIADHESKEVWTDRFDRAPGRVGNGWTLDQGFGPLVDLRDETVHLEGQNDRGGRTRAFRKLPPTRFIAFSATLTVGAEAVGTRSGLFIGSERTRPGGETQVTAELTISRNRDGVLEVRVQKSQTDDEATHEPVVGPDWAIGQPIEVSIERVGEDLESTFTVYVDGEPVAQGLECDRLLASRTALHFGAFVEGEAGRRADLKIDDVRVVRRR
ncbi:MAG: tetratricopeptide repeat protein [Planctomycetota bacterium]